MCNIILNDRLLQCIQTSLRLGIYFLQGEPAPMLL